MDSSVSSPCLTLTDVADVIRAAKKKPRPARGALFQSKSNNLIRRCDVVWLNPMEITDVYRKVFSAIDRINKENWNISFDALNTAQYTEYGIFGHYSKHIDLGSGAIKNRKLSASVNLTPPSKYWGGRLETWRGNVSREIGHITVFPSYLPHRVRPVWRGRRRSLVFWATGVPFS